MSETKENGRRSAPRLPVEPAYEPTNRECIRYLVGRLGTPNLLVVPTDEISQKDRVRQLVVAKGPNAMKRQAALAAGLPKLEIG